MMSKGIGKPERRHRPPGLSDFFKQGYLKNGDQIVYAIGKPHFFEGEVLFRKNHKATIRVKNKHLKKLVHNNQHILKQILSAVVKHPGDCKVEEVLKMDHFTTCLTNFVQLAHQLQQHETSNSPSNQRKRKETPSQPHGPTRTLRSSRTSWVNTRPQAHSRINASARKRLLNHIRTLTCLLCLARPYLVAMTCSYPWENSANFLIRILPVRAMGEDFPVQTLLSTWPNRIFEQRAMVTGERNVKACWEGTFQLNVESRSSSGSAVATTDDEEEEQHQRAHNSDSKGPTLIGEGDNGPYRAYKRNTDDDPRAVEDDRLIFEDDLILKLNFDTIAANELCRGFQQFPEAKQGMQEGMLLYIPREMVENVLEEDGEGCLLAQLGDTGVRKFSFRETFLQACQQKNRGIAHMICNPSGGGKCEHAYLDYSKMITGDTPHLRCVFVKEREVRAYRMRYPELILGQHASCQRSQTISSWATLASGSSPLSRNCASTRKRERMESARQGFSRGATCSTTISQSSTRSTMTMSRPIIPQFLWRMCYASSLRIMRLGGRHLRRLRPD